MIGRKIKKKKRTEITEKLSLFFHGAWLHQSNTDKVKIYLYKSKISLETKAKHPLRYA